MKDREPRKRQSHLISFMAATAIFIASCTEPPMSQSNVDTLRASLEQPGSIVNIYKGVYRLKPGLNHRSTPAIEDPELTGSFNTRYTNDNDEVITNPIIVTGESTDLTRSLNDPWMAFFHPDQGLIFVALSHETSYLIERIDQGSKIPCTISSSNLDTQSVQCTADGETFTVGQFKTAG